MRVTEAISHESDLWDRAHAGIAAFLEATTQPVYQTMVIRQAPIALGWQRRRDLVTQYYGGLSRDFGDMLDSAGLSDHSAAMLIATMRGTLTELASEIAQSSDQDSARQRAFSVVEPPLGMCRRPPPGTARAESIGIGELCTRTNTYLDRVEAGETLHVTRGGRVVAQLQQPR